MAAKPRDLGFPIPAKLVESVLMGQGDTLQLQDSPILGDVWIAFAAQPAEVQDLLITPSKEARAGAVAREISARIGMAQKAKRASTLREIARDEEGTSIAYLQGIVAAKLYFDEVLSVLVPMTEWWRERDVPGKLVAGTRYTENLARWMAELFASVPPAPARARKSEIRHAFSALDRYLALAGLILWASEQKRPKREEGKLPTVAELCREIQSHINAIAQRLVEEFVVVSKLPRAETDASITQVSINRPAAPALDKSIPAVKADAARNLFRISCKEITWAVIDSGIQSDHPAFQGDRGRRVKRALDFTRVRDIVSSDTIKGSRRGHLLEGITLNKGEATKLLNSLEKDAKAGLPTNWELVEELITLDQDDPLNRPRSFHGTHVAGIIGAAPKEESHPGGMCPDIQLYDFRVLDRTLEETEFAVIAALQYIRYLNERHTRMSIHGAN